MQARPAEILLVTPVTDEAEKLQAALCEEGLSTRNCRFEDLAVELSGKPVFTCLALNLDNSPDPAALKSATRLSEQIRAHETTSHLRLLLLGCPQLNSEANQQPNATDELFENHAFNDILFGPLRLPAALSRIRAQSRLNTISSEATRRRQLYETYQHLNLTSDTSVQSDLSLRGKTVKPTILLTGRTNGLGYLEACLQKTTNLIPIGGDQTLNDHLDNQKAELIIINAGRQPASFFSLIETIRKSPSAHSLPILMVAHPSPMDQSHIAYQSGLTDIITSPVDQRELILRCNNLIEEYRLSTSLIRSYKPQSTHPCHDALTGLYTRSAALTALDMLLASSKDNPRSFSLMTLQIDELREINKQHGHPAGDLILRQCAEIITRTIRGEDFAARISEDCFSITLPDTQADAAENLRQRLISIIHQTPLIVSPEKPPIEVSLTTRVEEIFEQNGESESLIDKLRQHPQPDKSIAA